MERSQIVGGFLSMDRGVWGFSLNYFMDFFSVDCVQRGEHVMLCEFKKRKNIKILLKENILEFLMKILMIFFSVSTYSGELLSEYENFISTLEGNFWMDFWSFVIFLPSRFLFWYFFDEDRLTFRTTKKPYEVLQI